MESPLWIVVFYFDELLGMIRESGIGNRVIVMLWMNLKLLLRFHIKSCLNKQGQPRSICVIRVSKGPALVNDKTDAVELGELEREINTETLSFNNVQSQENDYWQDLEILLENDVRLQANDDNEVDENIDDYRDGMDINVDDQNV
ncbi:hypothetical protein Fot_39906 [Forsythia ovata]|uniref:Uncharacterized protein n=1 Tax=Forsythia ovata TaxID=205694 RepID=A0ABD1S9Q3_9LAMI